MFEELLEDVAQTNNLRMVNTYLKLFTGLGGIILCLLSTSYLAPLFIAVILTLSILLLARIPILLYSQLFIVPLLFTVMSVSVIILLSGGNEIYWNWNLFSWLSLSITKESVNTGIFILFRVVGGMTALMFIALTTPMTDLFVVMRRIRIPETVVDLGMIIYRTIFLIMDQLVITYQAQVMRLGYGSFRESITSFSTLCGSAFISSWDSGEDLIRSMDARCYDGRFPILGDIRPVEPLPLFAAISFLCISSLVVIFTRNLPIL
jgi:cobalt/nickel transport system permease protein